MAIIQISKQQQRSGNLVDLPQLDEAEFGFATDVKKLYIGKESPNENIEVLTSYSNIAFSQLEGSVGNLDISAVSVQDGQVLAYDGTNWVNRGGDAGGLITLGDVSNVKITGGAIGYILETDGTGNLSWSAKGVLTASIENVTQADPGVVTTSQENFFVNGTEITISDVTGMTELNGNTYYVKVLTSTTFELYSDSALTSNVDTTGYTEFPYATVTETFAGTNKIEIGNTALFSLNDPVKFVGTLFGGLDTSTQYYIKTIPDAGAPGNVTVSTTAGGANVVLSNATGTANLYVTGGRIVSSLASGGGSPGGSPSSIQFNTAGAFDGDADLTWNKTTNLLTVTGNANIGNVNVSNTVIAKTFISNIATGTAPFTVSSTTEVANLNAAKAGVANTVNNSAQPNITSVGTLVSLSVTGNISSSANISATSNVSGGNLTTTGVLSVTGNANVGNLGTSGQVIATGNVTGSNLSTTGVVSATGNITGGNLVTSGKANVNALEISGTITGNLIPSANITYDLGNNTNRFNDLYLAGTTLYLGTITLQDDSGALEISKLSVTGNANISNVGVSGLVSVTGNITGGNITTTGLLSVTGNANLANINSSGTSNLGNILVNSGNANVSSLNASSINSIVLTTPTAPSGSITPSGGLLLIGNYYFKIVAVDSTGLTTVAGSESSLFDVTSNLSQISLSWTAVDLAKSYRIYWASTSGSYTNGYFTSTTNSYVVTTTAGTTVGSLPSVNTTGSANIATDLKVGSNVVITGNLTSSNINVTSTLTVTGNANIGNVTSNVIKAGGSNTSLGTITGTWTVNGGASGNSLILTNGNLFASGIKNDNYYYANGVPIDFNGTYSNSNVASYLPSYTGNITANVISATNISTTSNLTASSNVTGSSVVGTFDVRVGNVAADQWGRLRYVHSTSLYGFTYNSTGVTVITNEEAAQNQALVLGDSTGTGTIFGVSTYAGGTGSPTTGTELGWAPKLTLDSNGNLILTGKITSGNLYPTGIVSDNYYYGNGSPINFGGNYSNSNVQNYLPVYGGNIVANNITATNISSTTLSITGNVNIGNLTSNVIKAGGSNTSLGTITGTWTVNGGASGNSLILTNGNLYTPGIRTDNYYYSNGDPISFSGLYSNANVANYLPVYKGNIDANNLFATSISATTVTSSGPIQSISNVISSNLFINNTASIANLRTTVITTGSNTTAGTITGTWTLNGGASGNSLIVANGNIITTGIKTDNFYYANGTAVNFNGTYSNSNVQNYLPVYGGNIVANNIAATNISSTTFSASGNIIGANITANSNLQTANLTVTNNANIANLTVTGEFILTGDANIGNINASESVTGNNVIGLGDLRVGNVAADQWGRVRFTQANVLYGFEFGNLALSPGVVSITNEEDSRHQAIVLGDNVNGANTLFGISVLATGNSSPSTGTEPGWTPRLKLDGNGNLKVTGNVIAFSILTNPADLAEYFEADKGYEPATVVEFGGEKEITLATNETTRVAGVVSTSPAYAMNANLQGQHPTLLALQGRVPTKVYGEIKKGDLMVSAGNGYAKACATPVLGSVIGKSLENFSGTEGIIEIVVGRL